MINKDYLEFPEYIRKTPQNGEEAYLQVIAQLTWLSLGYLRGEKGAKYIDFEDSLHMIKCAAEVLINEERRKL